MGGLRDYLDHSRHWQTGIMLVVPLFALYELGLLLLPGGEARNAAQVLLSLLFHMDGPRGHLILNGGVLVLFLVAAASKGEHLTAFGYLPLLLVESLFYAALLVPLGTLVVPLAPDLKQSLSGLVASVGAGLYEELLFRLIGVAGLYAVLRRLLGMQAVAAASFALMLAALLFSAYHHMGAGGEPFEAGVFVFRFLAGMLLGWLFILRGFAVVCWSHALYDILWIFWLSRGWPGS